MADSVSALPPIASVVAHACMDRLSFLAASVNQRRFFMELIKTLRYEGSINHFRSLMDSFLMSIDNLWKVEGYDVLEIRYEPNLRAPGREAWTVEHNFREDEPHDNCYAGIFAFESRPNLTEVKFFDGRQYFSGSKKDFNEALGASWFDAQPIGESLLILSHEIERLWKEFSPESTPEEPKMKIKNKRGRRSPNLDTSEKIRKLLKIRNDAIYKQKEIPKWSVACNLAGIDHKTALNYLSELRPRWEDSNYQWAGNFGEFGESGEF